MSATLTRKERLLRQIKGQETDRIPMIGGWMLGSKNLSTIAGLSEDEFMKDAWAGVVKANLALDCDAIVFPIVPRSTDQVRDSHLKEEDFSKFTADDLKRDADALPDTEADVLKSFNAAECRAHYRKWFEFTAEKYGELVPVPNHWEAVCNFALYFRYGYQAFLEATAYYPEEIEKMFWNDALHARERNRILVEVIRDMNLLPMLFCGHDICDNKGPMCSPRFLKKHYWPHTKMSVAPLVGAGIRLIHHCDGNVIPLIDDMLDCGFAGFQGFQYECNVDPYVLAAKTTRFGEKPLFMAGMSVTRTLPWGSLQDVRDEVDYLIDYTDGGRRMFLFTSNVTGIEVPADNIIEGYRHCRGFDPAKGRGSRPQHLKWPWLVSHPDGM